MTNENEGKIKPKQEPKVEITQDKSLESTELKCLTAAYWKKKKE